jgi:hypothetical protein
MKNKLHITCPECGHQFSPEAAIESHVRIHLEEEYAKKLAEVRKAAEERAMSAAKAEVEASLKALQKEAAEKDARVKELEQQSLKLAQKEKELRKREERNELEFSKRLMEEEERIRVEAEKDAREKAEVELRQQRALLKRQQDLLKLSIKKAAAEEIEKVRAEEQLRHAELQSKLDEQVKLAAEMNRKGNQGSMQLQGEVQEVAMEEFLSSAFPMDRIEEISKGVRGADCLHVVVNNFGNTCGQILYESKRTKAFSKDWIRKLKDDMRLKQADIAVIVTDAMPAGLNRFGQIDGIWICTFAEFRSVSLLLRYAIQRMGEAAAAGENRETKMQFLYNYLTGNEFRQKIDAIREAFEQMSTDLQKERIQAIANFAKREKQIMKVIENTVSLYGDIKGIAGGAIQSIPELDIGNDEVGFLKEAAFDKLRRRQLQEQ